MGIEINAIRFLAVAEEEEKEKRGKSLFTASECVKYFDCFKDHEEQPVWPDADTRSSQNSSKRCPKNNSSSSSYLKDDVFNIGQTFGLFL